MCCLRCVGNQPCADCTTSGAQVGGPSPPGICPLPFARSALVLPGVMPPCCRPKGTRRPPALLFMRQIASVGALFARPAAAIAPAIVDASRSGVRLAVGRGLELFLGRVAPLQPEEAHGHRVGVELPPPQVGAQRLQARGPFQICCLEAPGVVVVRHTQGVAQRAILPRAARNSRSESKGGQGPYGQKRPRVSSCTHIRARHKHRDMQISTPGPDQAPRGSAEGEEPGFPQE